MALNACGQMESVIVCSIEELIDNLEELFHIRRVITHWEMHLVTMIDGVPALTCHPIMFHFHGAKILRTERREKRDNRIVKSNGSKRSRHGELFQFERYFHQFLIPLL